MKLTRFEIWLADLNQGFGSEAGKIRPVLVVQSNLINELNPSSTIVCPITSKVLERSTILRVHIPKILSILTLPSDIMIDQIRAIDNRRFVQYIGRLPKELETKVTENMAIVLGSMD